MTAHHVPLCRCSLFLVALFSVAALLVSVPADSAGAQTKATSADSAPTSAENSETSPVPPAQGDWSENWIGPAGIGLLATLIVTIIGAAWKLGARTEGLATRIGGVEKNLDRVEGRIEGLGGRQQPSTLEATPQVGGTVGKEWLEAQFAKVEAQFARLDARLNQSDLRVERLSGDVNVKAEGLTSDVRSLRNEFEGLRSELNVERLEAAMRRLEALDESRNPKDPPTQGPT